MIAAMHKRPLVSELWCIAAVQAVEFCRLNANIIAKAFAIVSDQESHDLCIRYGIETIITEAAPLGRKFNEGFQKALGRYDFDYLLSMGDDDIFPIDIIEFYSPAMEDNLAYFGSNQIYFLDALQGTAIKFRYSYQAPKIIGAGRMFRRDALERAGWKVTITPRQTRTYGGFNLRRGIALTIPEFQAEYIVGMKIADVFQPRKFSLWRDEQIRGMDHESEMSMIMAGYIPVVLENYLIKKGENYYPKPFFTDVKSDVNIWSFDYYKKISGPVPVEEATSFFTRRQLEIIEEIRSRAKCQVL